MNANDVYNMSANELRIFIAQKLGWKAEYHHEVGWFLISPEGIGTFDPYWIEQGHMFGFLYESNAWAHTPNWPEDEKAALALCIEMLDRLNAKDKNEMWQLEITGCCIHFAWLAYGGGIYDSIGADRRDAMGMSQIAAYVLAEEDEKCE